MTALMLKERDRAVEEPLGITKMSLRLMHTGQEANGARVGKTIDPGEIVDLGDVVLRERLRLLVLPRAVEIGNLFIESSELRDIGSWQARRGDERRSRSDRL